VGPSLDAGGLAHTLCFGGDRRHVVGHRAAHGTAERRNLRIGALRPVSTPRAADGRASRREKGFFLVDHSLLLGLEDF
jgi:hypothetical protein